MRCDVCMIEASLKIAAELADIAILGSCHVSVAPPPPLSQVSDRGEGLLAHNEYNLCQLYAHFQLLVVILSIHTTQRSVFRSVWFVVLRL